MKKREKNPTLIVTICIPQLNRKKKKKKNSFKHKERPKSDVQADALSRCSEDFTSGPILFAEWDQIKHRLLETHYIVQKVQIYFI